MEPLTNANTKFALDLLRQLSAENRTENIFFSPLSVSTALLMVHLGARGNTAIQMAKVLHLGAEEQPHCGFQQLQCDVNKPSPSHLLKTANGLYGERSFNFHSVRGNQTLLNKKGKCVQFYYWKGGGGMEEYIESVSKFYQTEITAVDFAEEAEEARIQINSWVEERTEGKIQNLLAQGAVDSQSKLVLVNAVYFKGMWEKKFNEEATKERLFRFSEDESKPMKMMYQKGTFKTSFIEELATDILELPYVQNELSMLILLPEEIGGLEELEQKLTSDKLLQWTSPENLDPSEMSVYLPKFKLEANYDLESTLTLMGMSEAFDCKSADFSGMTVVGSLSLSKIVHKSFVEVNEEGTEAAASSQATMMFRSFHFENEFIADHPFLFFIRHNKTQSILFFGRFSSP